MKKIQKLVIALLVISAVLPACKKGADDPFLSLRSRKSRVAGEWTVSTLTDSRNSVKSGGSGSSNYNVTEVVKVDGSSYSDTYTESGSSDTENGTVSTYTIKFEKDGKWNSIFEYSVVTTNPSITHTVTTRTESSGTWNFLGKIGDAKNKENISVSTISEKITSTTQDTFTPGSTLTDVNVTTKTYAENENVEIWKLTELKNKELKAEISIGNSSTDGTVTTSVTGSIAIVLKQ